MNTEIVQLEKKILAEVGTAHDLTSLEALEQRIFSRKNGEFTWLMNSLRDASPAEKKEKGRALNEAKTRLEEAFRAQRATLSQTLSAGRLQEEAIDVTQPFLPRIERGHLHPITQALYELEHIARGMGFIVEDGPEIESEYYVFDALNVPEHHPARDVQDTFYLKDMPGLTMRSHVSGMQVRQMQTYGAPLRAVHLGRVFRNEALDATHGHTFYQFDCIVVDKNLSIGNMVGVIKAFLEGLYKREVELRLRPSYFPFVEPAIEIEMKITTGVGSAQKTKWVEISGSGLIHPNVIRAGGLDPEVYDGFAFSFGLDRLVMGKYKIEDIRHIHAGDLRFLEQF